jgi:hypothetical protein
MIPQLKKGMGKISGPTPNNKLTDVNNAAYFGLLII